MSNLNITDLKPEQAQKRDFGNSDITLKRDGTLIYFKDGKLFSPRCERSERFRHILNVLKQNNVPELYGEMYIEGGNVFSVSSSENWKALEDICPECMGKSKELNSQGKLNPNYKEGKYSKNG